VVVVLEEVLAVREPTAPKEDTPVSPIDGEKAVS
jgi:hypothetical protein